MRALKPLLPLLVFSSFAAQANPLASLTLCITVGGGECTSDPSYEGPLSSYEGFGSDEMERREYEAYRQGKVKELDEYRQHIEREIIRMNVEMQEAELEAEALEKMTSEIKAALRETYATPPLQDLSYENRRALNPLPEPVSEEQMQAHLDPVWEAVRTRDPVEMSERLSKLADAMVPIPGTDISRIPRDQAEFLKSELTIVRITNGQGLLLAPFADTPDDPMYTSAATYIGADLRRGMNQLLAAQSVVGTLCANQELANCAEARRSLEERISRFYALDHMIGHQGGLNAPELFAQYEELMATADFSAGVAKGIWDGGVNTVTGLAQMIAHPVNTVKGIASAIVNYDRTADMIAKAFEARYEALQSGSAFERGQVVGEAVFEIAAAILPASKASKLSGVMRAGIYEAAAEVVAKSPRLSAVISPFEIRAANAMQKLGLKGVQATEFRNWAVKHLDAGDDGRLVNTFSANITRERYGVLRTLQDKLETSDNSKIYLTRQVAFEQKILAGARFSAADLTEMSTAYDRLDQALMNFPTKASPPEGFLATRGVKKSYMDGGVEYANDPSKIFAVGEFNQYSSHRFSQPGQKALYTSLGPEARKAIAAEIDAAEADILFAQKAFKPSKILDLSNQGDLAQYLNLTFDDLTWPIALEPKAYMNTQIIGHLAAEHGFDAILVPSSKNPKTLNLILLE